MNACCCSSSPSNPLPMPRESEDFSTGAAASGPTLPFLVKAAMRISRTRWYGFLRRVFQYQNGMRADSGANPFDSGTWLTLELASLLIQIAAVTAAMAVSHKETPVWPLRVWAVGYNLGNLLTLPVLYWRYRHAGASASRFSDVEQQRRSGEETRGSYRRMERIRTLLELYFAVWFVMGNIWVFAAGHGSSGQSPVLHTLCVALLAWNAVGYSFPFVLFLLLCCCVPLVSGVLGYNMNLGSEDRGASDHEIASIRHWRLTDADADAAAEEDMECCICLARYKNKEEVRQLPCSHLFHLRCVDQWLKVTACCPVCKQQLER